MKIWSDGRCTPSPTIAEMLFAKPAKVVGGRLVTTAWTFTQLDHDEVTVSRTRDAGIPVSRASLVTVTAPNVVRAGYAPNSVVTVTST